MRSTAALSSSPRFLHNLFFSTADLFITGTLNPKSKNLLTPLLLLLLQQVVLGSSTLLSILFLAFRWSRLRSVLLFLFLFFSSGFIPRAACLFFLLLIPQALHNDCTQQSRAYRWDLWKQNWWLDHQKLRFFLIHWKRQTREHRQNQFLKMIHHLR